MLVGEWINVLKKFDRNKEVKFVAVSKNPAEYAWKRVKSTSDYSITDEGNVVEVTGNIWLTSVEEKEINKRHKEIKDKINVCLKK